MAHGPSDRKPTMMVVPRIIHEDDEPTKIGKIEDLRTVKPRSRDKAYFIVLAGANLGQMYKIDSPGETVLGRAQDATIRLQDDGISRRHAKVTQVGNDLVIEDMQSANGTVINGKV